MPASSHVVAYRNTRERITAMARAIDTAAAGRTVPATPDWTVRDLLAHLVGLADDAVNGRLDGVATDPWTAAQVEARRGRGVAELLGEWEDRWPRFSELLGVVAEAEPLLAAQAVIDVVTHELDLAFALGLRPGPDPVAWPLARALGVRFVGDSRQRRDAGALAIRTPEGAEHLAGVGEPTATVTVPALELFRAMTGRRSTDQISAWKWEGDWVVTDVCFFTPRATDLVEPDLDWRG